MQLDTFQTVSERPSSCRNLNPLPKEVLAVIQVEESGCQLGSLYSKPFLRTCLYKSSEATVLGLWVFAAFHHCREHPVWGPDFLPTQLRRREDRSFNNLQKLRLENRNYNVMLLSQMDMQLFVYFLLFIKTNSLLCFRTINPLLLYLIYILYSYLYSLLLIFLVVWLYIQTSKKENSH